MEVVEGFKEGYESDVLESEMPISDTTTENKKSTVASDEDVSKETTETNDSDEDFNIDNYMSYTKDSIETTESSSIRYLFRKV